MERLVDHQVWVVRWIQFEDESAASQRQRRTEHRGADFLLHTGNTVQIHRPRQLTKIQICGIRRIRQRRRLHWYRSAGYYLNVARKVCADRQQQRQLIVRARFRGGLQDRQAVTLWQQSGEERWHSTAGCRYVRTNDRQARSNCLAACCRVIVEIAKLDDPRFRPAQCCGQHTVFVDVRRADKPERKKV